MAIDFSSKPYFDDFDPKKNYLKILFKPGYPIQARELNQLQSNLKKQIETLGTHFFKNGAIVIPGTPKLDSNAKYVILQDLNNDPEILSKLEGVVLTQDFGGNSLKGKVVRAESLTGNYVLVIVQYLNSATFDDGGEIVNKTEFDNALSISVEGDPSFNLTLPAAGPNSEPVTGKAVLYTVTEGVFFIDGNFVHTPTQTVIVDWNFTSINKKAGFDVQEKIVTAYDDPSLFDNALGSTNEGAPGADRYAVDLNLVVKELDDDNGNFIELLRIVDGALKVNVQYTQYNVLEETLARRTYDESGDYTVRGLEPRVLDHLKDENTPKGLLSAADGGDDNKFAVEISAGKAYIKGFEVENQSNLYLTANKSRTPDSLRTSLNNLQVNQNGTYIYLAPGNQFFDITRHPIIWLTNGVENTSDIIGYCIPKHMEAISISGQTVFKLFGTFRLAEAQAWGWQHIGGWKLDDLKNGPVLQVAELGNVVSNFTVNDGLPLNSHTGYTPYAWDSANRKLYLKKSKTAGAFDTTIQVVKGAASGYVTNMTFKESFEEGEGDLIKLGISNVKTIKDELGNVNIQAEMAFTTLIGTDASGFGSYTLTGDGVFVGQPVAAHTSIDNAYFNNLVNISPDGKTLTINNASYPNSVFAVSAQLSKNLAVKSKSLQEVQVVIPNPSARGMVLPHRDVYRIKAVYQSADLSTAPTTSDQDVTDFFELKNNDTLDFYGNAILVSKGGAASGQLLVVLEKFLHSAGDVFTVDSYTALRDNPVDENDVTHIGRIPTFETTDKIYNLSDYLDFRQVPQDGFFIIKGQVTTGSAVILTDYDYSNVISAGAQIWANGFETGTTVNSVTPTQIECADNSTVTGTVYVVVNSSTSLSVADVFDSQKSLWAPLSGQAFLYDATYFVSRYDRVVMFKDGRISYIYGVPGVDRYPEIPENSMSLAKLIVPPYTKRAAEIIYEADDNRRYTMRDIGKLEKRIENLEYYTSLSLKELETKELKITDASGLERFKSGFFVSDFRNFGVFNPFNGQFQCTLDSQERVMTPLEYTDAVDLKVNETTSVNYVIKGDTIFLPYTDKLEIEQPYATKTETVNPYLIIKWNTQMTLRPNSDFWIETEWAPTITNVRNLTNTVVNERTVYNDKTINRTSVRIAQARRWGHRREVNITKDVKESLNRVYTESTSTKVDVNKTETVNLLGTSIIPLMRPREIYFKVTGAKPETRFWAQFDGVDVTPFCKPVGGNYGDPIISDSMGIIEGFYKIPANRFSTGVKTFSIADVNLVEYPEAGVECEASADYSAYGRTETYQKKVDIVKTTTNTINKVKVVNRVTTVNRETVLFPRLVVRDGGRQADSRDPLAQSFDTLGIDADGMFVTKLDLFFAKKDPTMPVYLELRNMVNGYPENERIPGSLVTLSPDQVNVSDDSTVPTTFEFEKPVFLPANREYCFVLMSNSSRYHVWISELGEKVVNEDKIVGKQPHLGSLFKSQNASTWTPFQYQDMKFKLYRAKFNPATSGAWDFNNEGVPSRRKVELSNLSTTAGSNLVTVKHYNHGLQTNEIVNLYAESDLDKLALSPTPSMTFNGIPMSEIYGKKTVVNVIDINTYQIEVVSNATETGNFKDVGRYIWADGNSNFYRFRISVDDFVPSECSIRYEANLITGKDFDGGQTPKVVIPPFFIKNDNINDLEMVALLQTPDNEVEKSMTIRAEVKTDNEYLSPTINIDNNVAIFSALALNKPNPDDEVLADFEAGKVASKAITQVIRLKTPADSLKIFTVESKQEPDGIEIYYRVTSNRDIESKPWVYLPPVKNNVTASVNDYVEIERSVDEVGESFDEFQIKILFKGTNSVKYPSIKELRAIAVAG